MGDPPAAPAAGGFWKLVFFNPAHGPLPVLLLGLTVLTGTVDSVSILELGRVFVANMTGNVVFVGFAVAGAPGFALGASLVALAGFLIGAASGGRLANRYQHDRAVLLVASTFAQLVAMVIALGIAAVAGELVSAGSRYSIAVLLAWTMGVQNAVVRRLAVPDLTTTVLTLTLTGIAADVRAGAWNQPSLWRRVLAVAAMFGGAVAGAGLVIHDGAPAALGLATGLLAVVFIGATAARRRPGNWRQA